MAVQPVSDLKRFTKSFLIVLSAIIILDFAIGHAMAYMYSRQKSGLLYRATYSIDSTTAEYIVVGSSRANHHYDPRVFEKKLETSFYNCGRDGQRGLYSFAAVSAAITRYTPKCVIIDILPDDFTNKEEGTLSTLLPYNSNLAVQPYLQFNGKFQSVKLLSSIYPYNSLFTNLIVGMKAHHEDDYKGYIPLSTLRTDEHLIALAEIKPADSAKINAFYELMSQLEKRKIRTLLIISPIFANYTGSVTPLVCQAAVARFRNVRFLNYLNVKDWQHKEDFSSDEFHLNKDGAIKFSTEIAQILIKEKL